MQKHAYTSNPNLNEQKSRKKHAIFEDTVRFHQNSLKWRSSKGASDADKEQEVGRTQR
jgi:hypothetical protein